MNLDRHGREFYQLGITTDPVTAPTDWEASFDRGETWAAAIDRGGPCPSGWLVEGVAAPPPVEGTVLATRVRPLLRLVDSPEFIVRNAPPIYVN